MGTFGIILKLSIVLPLAAVLSIENEGIVTGKAVEYSVLDSSRVNVAPEQTLYRLTIRVQSFQVAANQPNFLGERIGEDIEMYSKDPLPAHLFGRCVKARITYRGRAGRAQFWLRAIAVCD